MKEKWTANPKEDESAPEYNQEDFVERRPSGAWLTSCGSPKFKENSQAVLPLVSMHALQETDVSGRYVLPPHSAGAVYHDFLRYVLPELSQDVDLQTGIHLSSLCDCDCDCGPSSVVGIATGYGLEGPAIES